MAELKPCPFCKSKASYEFNSDWGIVVTCTKCGALMTETVYPILQDAIEGWNKRAEDTCEGCKYEQFKSGIRCSLCSRDKRDYYLPLREVE